MPDGRPPTAHDEIRVWLYDDVVDRAAPVGWIQVTTPREAIELLDTGRVVELSLDHNLGDDELFGREIEGFDRLAATNALAAVVIGQPKSVGFSLTRVD